MRSSVLLCARPAQIIMSKDLCPIFSQMPLSDFYRIYTLATDSIYSQFLLGSVRGRDGWNYLLQQTL